ncbi:MAG: AMP-binding protein [Spirochaetes bacterium]|nr:AMP-binding protein [Spirochaetota bacterium]
MSKKYNYTYDNLVQMVYLTSRNFQDRISHKFRSKNSDNEFITKTYKEYFYDICCLAYAFNNEGIKKEDHVAFYSNNRYEWTLTDFALLMIGAVSVPRGSDTTPIELNFITNHSDSTFIIFENIKIFLESFKIFDNDLKKKLKKIFIIDKPFDIKSYINNLEDPLYEEIYNQNENNVIYYDDLFLKGKKLFDEEMDQIRNNKKEKQEFIKLIESINKEDLATIIYTSGTTGNPKGVMLTHKNFLHNVKNITPRMELDEENGEVTVSILPTWHVYERTYEYVALSAGTTFVYSNIKFLSQDLEREKPTIFVTVPRIWESIYSKLMSKIYEGSKLKRYLFYFFLKNSERNLLSKNYLKGCYLILRKQNFLIKFILFFFHLLRYILTFPFSKLSKKIFKPILQKVGGRLKGAFSGGGSLPPYLDNFFNSIGIPLINAYGLTETSPGVLSRSYERNTLGATGIPFSETYVKLLDLEGNEVKMGQKGVLWVKGENVMKGYYKNKEATDAIISKDGWLNTGDLCIQSFNGDYVIVGRAKDTIVLLGGENVEPEPIENKLKESELIDHAVVRGQDKKNLTAIIAINEEALKKLMEKLGFSKKEIEENINKDVIDHPTIFDIIKKEVNKLISKEHGFKPFEQISKILPIKNKFQIGQELTQSLKIKRKYIEEKYKEFIKKYLDKEEKKNK